MTRNIEEELLSRDEFVELVVVAESMRQADKVRQNLPDSLDTSRKLTLGGWLEDPKSIGIDRDYMMKAMEARFLPIKTQLIELTEHNGKPSIKLIFDTYCSKIEKRFREIVSPEFRIHKSYEKYRPKLYFYEIVETEEITEKGLIFKKEKKAKIDKEIPLATLYFASGQCPDVPEGKFSIRLDLQDARILHFFGENIKKLNDYYKQRGLLYSYDMNYDYEQNIDEIEFESLQK